MKKQTITLKQSVKVTHAVSVQDLEQLALAIKEDDDAQYAAIHRSVKEYVAIDDAGIAMQNMVDQMLQMQEKELFVARIINACAAIALGISLFYNFN